MNGPLGAAFALALNYVAYTICVLWVGWKLIGFKWSEGVIQLIAFSAVLVAVASAAAFFMAPMARYLLGLALTVIAAATSLRGLSKRLGNEHRLVMALCRIPGARRLLGA
jgi:hypothetical protein